MSSVIRLPALAQVVSSIPAPNDAAHSYSVWSLAYPLT